MFRDMHVMHSFDMSKFDKSNKLNLTCQNYKIIILTCQI